MNRNVDVLEWFSDEQLPDVYTAPAIISGGRSLLREFVSLVGRSRDGGNILIVAPFVGKDVVSEILSFPRFLHRCFKVRALTGSIDADCMLEEQLKGYNWESLEIAFTKQLHAKIYAFVDEAGGGACLIGSHNFSEAAVVKNDEAGVLFVSNGNDFTWPIVDAWSKRANEMFWGSRRVAALESRTGWRQEIKQRKAG